MDNEYRQACQLMIAKGDVKTGKHAHRAITDGRPHRRQIEFNIAAQEFVRLEGTTQEERALVARFIRNIEDVRSA
jgi:hypothetical protein